MGLLFPSMFVFFFLLQVVDKARAAWAEKMKVVEIEGGTDDQKSAFYTAVYHTFIDPRIFGDLNGEYPGLDNKTHTV
jgi:putative alpha-1,2-mannosidase